MWIRHLGENEAIEVDTINALVNISLSDPAHTHTFSAFKTCTMVEKKHFL